MTERKLTGKQQHFIDLYMGECKRNGTQSAMKAYETDDYDTAKSIATENLAKPYIQAEIERLRKLRVKQAEDNIFKLADKAKSEYVRLQANQDIIDREKGKATQKQEVTGAEGKDLFTAIEITVKQ